MNKDLDLKDLPDEVRRAAGQDLILTGSCYVIQHADGTYEHIPSADLVIQTRVPIEWPKQAFMDPPWEMGRFRYLDGGTLDLGLDQ